MHGCFGTRKGKRHYKSPLLQIEKAETTITNLSQLEGTHSLSPFLNVCLSFPSLPQSLSRVAGTVLSGSLSSRLPCPSPFRSRCLRICALPCLDAPPVSALSCASSPLFTSLSPFPLCLSGILSDHSSKFLLFEKQLANYDAGERLYAGNCDCQSRG